MTLARFEWQVSAFAWAGSFEIANNVGSVPQDRKIVQNKDFWNKTPKELDVVKGRWFKTAVEMRPVMCMCVPNACQISISNDRRVSIDHTHTYELCDVL